MTTNLKTADFSVSRASFLVSGLVSAVTFSLLGGLILLGADAAHAQTESKAAKTVYIKLDPISSTGRPEKQDSRSRAINRALDQALDERARSHRAFQENAAAGRPRELSEERERLEVKVGDNGDIWSERLDRSRNSRLNLEAREARAPGRGERGERRRIVIED
jgi:hypothetical protein